MQTQLLTKEIILGVENIFKADMYSLNIEGESIYVDERQYKIKLNMYSVNESSSDVLICLIHFLEKIKNN